jgi:drug/metabolite transporter (DMT)-like permease
VGFLYKHRGSRAAAPVDMRHPLQTVRALFASRLFALGMVVATGGWILHVAAMAMAPLSVVQAVLAGGVVMLAVIAERMFGIRTGRRQWLGLGLAAIGLALLGFTLPAMHGAHSRFSLPGMIALEAGLVFAGTLLIVGPRIGASTQHHGYMLGAASGILFGVSDIAIKAISGEVASAGVAGLVSPWMVVTVTGSVAAFYTCAKAFQESEAVPVIAVTGTASNLAGIVAGIIVFGDPLSADPLSLAVQCLAFVFVLTAAWLMPAPVRAVARA